MINDIRTYFDIFIRDIQIIIFKQEDSTFRYECSNRVDAGFIIITKGTGYFKCGDYERNLKQGDVLLIDKIDKYVIGASDDNFAYVTTAFSLGEGQRFRAYNIPYRISLDYETIKPLLDKLLSVWKSKPLNYKIQARLLLNQLLVDCTNKNVNKYLLNDKFKHIYPTLKFINENYNKNINLDKVAEMAGYSISHYRKMFKEYLGISPQQYIINIRIDTAKEMIKTGMFSFNYISEELGYSDIYHFSKDFKKNVGQSPKVYQTANLTKDN